MDNFLKIVDTFMPIITIVLSTVIAHFVSKSNAKKEVEKSKLEYQNLKTEEFNSLFTKLMSATEQYRLSQSITSKLEAIEAVISLLNIAPKPYVRALQKLHNALSENNISKINEFRFELLHFHLKHK